MNASKRHVQRDKARNCSLDLVRFTSLGSVSNCQGEALNVRITNAGKASYPTVWRRVVVGVGACF